MIISFSKWTANRRDDIKVVKSAADGFEFMEVAKKSILRG
jgi:hypothetical protein